MAFLDIYSFSNRCITRQVTLRTTTPSMQTVKHQGTTKSQFSTKLVWKQFSGACDVKWRIQNPSSLSRLIVVVSEGADERGCAAGRLPQHRRTFPLKIVRHIVMRREVRLTNYETSMGGKRTPPSNNNKHTVASPVRLTCRGLRYRGAARGERLLLSRCRSETELWNPLR